MLLQQRIVLGTSLLFKTDTNGNEQWRKTFEGKGGDSKGKAVRVTNDGGYIVVGYTISPALTKTEMIARSPKF